MPGRKPRTSRVLILITILLCLISGASFTQSSANPSPIDEGKMPDVFVSENVDDSAFTSEGTMAVDDSFTDDSQNSGEEIPEAEEPTAAPAAEPAVTEEPVPTEAPKPTETPEPEKEPEPTQTPVPTQEATAFTPSTEASVGVWTADGSHWRFMVNGVSYIGWFTDLDGHRYYFNADGLMHTGWLDADGNRYYLDADGILQTGYLNIDGTDYHFLEDGSLEGYVSDTTPAPEADEASQEAANADAADDPNAGDDASAAAEANSAAEQPKKTLALTFDDGPSSFTDRLLDCLEANNAKATFFMVGQEIDNFPDEVTRMEELGCELGNHTNTHVDLTTLSPEDMSAEIGATDQKLLELTGHGATVLRPPYGSIDDNVTAAVGTPMILWSVDTLDWETQDTQQIVDAVLSNAADGAILLLHDIFSTSVDAAEIFIPELIKQGYDLVTIHELAAAHNTELHTGIAYGAFE